MRLYHNHGNHLWKEADVKQPTEPSEGVPHSGDKRTHAEMEEHKAESNNSPKENKLQGQYFAKDLWLFSYREPCFMWAMACVHSRVARVYFVEANTKTGGLGGYIESKDNTSDNQNTGRSDFQNHIQIQWMKNLNHSFDVFKINLISQ